MVQPLNNFVLVCADATPKPATAAYINATTAQPKTLLEDGERIIDLSYLFDVSCLE
jgi:hypothetical protein